MIKHNSTTMSMREKPSTNIWDNPSKLCEGCGRPYSTHKDGRKCKDCGHPLEEHQLTRCDGCKRRHYLVSIEAEEHDSMWRGELH